MLEAGEDARFIARRLVILASEDVGMADPHGLVVADAAARAVEFVGLPEAQLNLAHAVVLPGHRAEVELGRPPRCGAAQADVRDQPAGAVPRAPARRAATRAPRSSGTARATCTLTTTRDGWVDQQYRPDESRTTSTSGRPATAPTSTPAERRRRDAARSDDGGATPE